MASPRKREHVFRAVSQCFIKPILYIIFNNLGFTLFQLVSLQHKQSGTRMCTRFRNYQRSCVHTIMFLGCDVVTIQT
jgi:hypothetical protein